MNDQTMNNPPPHRGMVVVIQLDPNIHPGDAVGILPQFLDLKDPRPASEQFDGHYQSGWRPQEGFTKESRHSFTLHYPGDPPFYPIACIPFRAEMIVIYPASYVAIFQKDGTFEICRMD